MSSPAELLKSECDAAAKQIMVLGAKLTDLGDRLRLCHWLRAISQLRTDQHESLKMKHEYLTFLQVILGGPYRKLTKPFDTAPPESFVPLAECVGNRIADQYQDLVPRIGPLQPLMCQKSDDDRAYLCVRRTPDNGILCYMCCAPDAASSSISKSS